MPEISAGLQVTPSIRLKRRLGAGGMGSVWVAEHSALKSDVVVKFLAERLADDPTSLARFSREAVAAAQARSPHIVQVLDHGVLDDEQPYIVMELLEGKDLAQEIRERPLAVDALALMVEHVALALSRAHSKGIIHRDIKPSNIFLCDVGSAAPFTKLLDFGVARGSDQPLTSTGHVVGTPAYMSPEQVSGRPIDHRTDLWSLGMVAFKAITGKNPFERPTIPETIGAVLHADLPAASLFRPDLSREIDAWLMRACERDPERRFASATTMAEALWEAIGVPKSVASSPSANTAPLPLISDTTVSITPDAVTEGTLRSVGKNSPSLPISIRPSSRKRLIGVALGLGLAAVAATSLGMVAMSGDAPAPLGKSMGASFVRVSAVAVKPAAAPAPVVAPAPAPTPEKPASVRSKPTWRPPPKKASQDDDVGF